MLDFSCNEKVKTFSKNCSSWRLICIIFLANLLSLNLLNNMEGKPDHWSFPPNQLSTQHIWNEQSRDFSRGLLSGSLCKVVWSNLIGNLRTKLSQINCRREINFGRHPQSLGELSLVQNLLHCLETSQTCSFSRQAQAF